jgi:hypothetical protein
MANKANVFIGIATAIGAIVGGGLALGGKIATKKDEADADAEQYIDAIDDTANTDDEEDTDAD